jgi:hypothetical protein
VSAFHESVAKKKLKELFDPPSSRTHEETLQAQCVLCQRTFAVFLHVKDDPQNERYFKQITRLIAEDCNDGKHSAELTVRD